MNPNAPAAAGAAAAAPRISVVVPTCNGAAHIVQTLQAVHAQTHAALELIVVDDGSSDGTLALIDACPGPLRLLHGPRRGVSAARNTGLAAASGEFVCFLDQDDIWHPEHLARQMQALALCPEAGVVVSPYQHWYPVQGRYPAPDAVLPPAQPVALDPDFSGWVYHQFMLDCWALTSATTLRREPLLRLGAFDEARPYGEDWELWLRLARELPFAALTWPPVLYRQHAEQGSRRPREIDHRSELLLQSWQRHGLTSRDGRRLDEGLFRRRLARYQREFGEHHLRHGDPAIGRRALWQAWRRDPLRWRSAALALASQLGWRPPSPGRGPRDGL